MKQCTSCEKYLPLSRFGARENNKLKSHCRDCVSRSNLERYHTKSSTREAHRKASFKSRIKSYGITIEQYNQMLKDQGYMCAICGWRESDRHMSVDHCHETGKVRGLLCNACNTGLGHAKEDIDVLKSMIDYLEKHK